MEHWDGICLEHDFLEEINEIVRWNKPVTFPLPGRTAWLTLPKPIRIQRKHRTLVLEALKFKGIGLYTSQGQCLHPSTESFCRFNLHLGITKEGKFNFLTAPPSPFGGITIERACTEFSISKHLLENDIPTQIPIRVYKYTDPKFLYKARNEKGSQLGVVVTGQLQKNYYRADLLYDKENSDKRSKAEANNFASVLSSEFSLTTSTNVSLLHSVLVQYGHYLRRFCECGLYRHNAHPVNLACSLSLKSIYLTDLDSTCYLKDCSALERPLQTMRDVVSSLMSHISVLIDPHTLHLFPVEEVCKANIFEDYLKSYYHDASPSLVRSFAEIVQEQYVKMYQVSLQHQSSLKQESLEYAESTSFRAKHRSRWEDDWFDPYRKEVYSWLISSVWELHNRSAIVSQYPFLISKEKLLENLVDFHEHHSIKVIKERIDSILSHLEGL